MIKKNNRQNSVLLIALVIFLVLLPSVSAATRYWLGNGLDFSIHSVNNFFVDNSNNRVGISTSTPDQTLQVVGNIMIGETDTTGGELYLYGTTAGKYSRLFTSNGNLHIDTGYGAGGDNGLYLNYYNGGNIYFGNGASGTHTYATTAGAWNFSNVLNIDGAGRVGISNYATAPGYLFDVKGTGSVASFYSSGGIALAAYGTTRGVSASSTSSAAVYGYATSGSGTNYGVYGETTTGYSGWFTGGYGLYADGYEVYQRGNCNYNYVSNAATVDCATGYDEVVGGGCNCANCGDNQVIATYPSSSTRWSCSCRNCAASGHESWIICCGY